MANGVRDGKQIDSVYAVKVNLRDGDWDPVRLQGQSDIDTASVHRRCL